MFNGARTSLVLLLFGANAFAHEATFRAAWIQPLAPIVFQRPILPLGFTQGLGSWADAEIEMTPSWWHETTCPFPNGCRDQVFGMIATVGIAVSHPILTVEDAELDWFAGPKALVAAAIETGTPGDPDKEFPFNPGTALQFGAGFDAGVQIHGRHFPWFASVVFGVQCTRAYNTGRLPTDFSYLLYSTRGLRAAGSAPIPDINPNLVRLGFVF